MMQMNNPVLMLVNAMRNGTNPNVLLNQMAMQNPQVRQAMNMLQGKSPKQVQQMVMNMAKERGTTVEEIARSLGLTMPNQRM